MGTPVVNQSTGFVTGTAPLSQAGLTGATVVTGYQFGPISAGSDSPLGQFFGFMNGLSTNYAAGLGIASNDFQLGLQSVVNAPAASHAVIMGQTLTPQQLADLKDASATPLNSSPFAAAGQIIGSILGTGVGTVGGVVGVAGQTAAPQVSSGAQEGARGVSDVAAAGASGGFAGAIQGLGSGLSTTLGQNVGDPSLIFIVVVVLVVILAAK